MRNAHPFLHKDIHINFDNNVFIAENSCIIRKFKIRDYFIPISFYQKRSNRELFSDSEKWFEIAVNNKLLNRMEFDDLQTRIMAHGGVEVVIRLTSDDVLAQYFLQLFPDCPITRERLSFFPKNKTMSLNHVDGKVHCLFPMYRLGSGKNILAEEIKLATWNQEQMPEADTNAFPSNRHFGPTDERGLNLSQCDMYHPVLAQFELNRKMYLKGPILIGRAEAYQNWLIAYEHGSPDNDPDRDYLKIGVEPSDADILLIVTAQKGAYFNGEEFSAEKPFSTVWCDFGTFDGDDIDAGRLAFRDFLYHWQSENSASRKPIIYYNTWGWQRDEENDYINVDEITDKRPGSKVYCDATLYQPITYYNMQAAEGHRKHFAPDEVLTNEDRLLQEIDHAHQIGADLFVLDDGWYDWMGDWNINNETFPKGLSVIKKRLDRYGMRLGLWLAPICIDQHSEIFRESPQFLARTAEGELISSRFGRQLACLSSPGYPEYFVEKCKNLIDMGCTYFKWDALDGWYCTSDQHNHGDSTHPVSERGDRYGYEYVHIVNKMARELTQYCRDLVIVYDITESGRFVGLDFLSQGRYFWMNNGASGYYDYSSLRAKSMRTIYYRYNLIIPSALQTAANYPHDRRNQPKNRRSLGSQEYNIYSTLVGGNGFWGNLGKLDDDERTNAGQIISKYKRVAKSVFAVRPGVSGSIGSSPEIYEFIDPEKAEGQVIAFSGSILKTSYNTQPIRTDKLLGVLNHGYAVVDGHIRFDFEFTEPDAVRGCFILGENQFGASVVKSTCWLKDLRSEEDLLLKIINGAPGQVIIHWQERLGQPVFETENSSGNDVVITMEKYEKGVMIIVDLKKPDISLKIKSE